MPKSTVLVVDNEPNNRDVVAFVLKDAFAVTQTDNARDAVRLARHHRPDVVVLDLVVPGMNRHVAHLIQAWCPETEIVAVSAPPTLVPFLDDGNFDAVMIEHCDRADLVDVVRRLCPIELTNADESIW